MRFVLLSTGKTQICLALSIQNLLRRSRCGIPKRHKSAYLSCGEGEFPIQRLSELANAFEQPNAGQLKSALLDDVLIEKCHTLDDILDTVVNMLPDMCRKQNVSFLCIDSIGGLARHEFDVSHKDQMFERSSKLFTLSQKLKWLSDTFDVCVVIINQVSSAIRDTNSATLMANECGAGITIGKDGLLLVNEDITPALGLVWAHCVNTRMILLRQSASLRRIFDFDNCGDSNRYPLQTEDGQHGDLDANNTLITDIESAEAPSSRYLFVQFSPLAPMVIIKYRITSVGVEGISCSHAN